MANLIAVSIASMGLVGGALALGLAYASEKFKVEVDPRVEEITGALPGANCGACGYPGCPGCAEAIASGKAPVSACPVGGAAVAEAIAAVMGVSAGDLGEPKVARLICGGDCSSAVTRSGYQGMPDCRAAGLVQGGPKGCAYGCLGFGNCAQACPFGALEMGEGHLPVVDPARCTACGKCVTACPRNLMVLAPRSAWTIVHCNSPAKGTEVRPVCKVGCIGCNICARECPEKAITVENNLARIDYGLCTGCGKCVEKCPMHTIVFLRPKPGQHVSGEGAQNVLEAGAAGE